MRQQVYLGLTLCAFCWEPRPCPIGGDPHPSRHLSDAGGQPINASRAMTFRLYDAADGGNVLWESAYGDVAIVDGVFSVVLGAQRAFGDDLIQSERLYLGVTVDGDAEMSPRMRVGGALKSQWAAVAAHARDVRGENIHPASAASTTCWWSTPMVNGWATHGPSRPHASMIAARMAMPVSVSSRRHWPRGDRGPAERNLKDLPALPDPLGPKDPWAPVTQRFVFR